LTSGTTTTVDTSTTAETTSAETSTSAETTTQSSTSLSDGGAPTAQDCDALVTEEACLAAGCSGFFPQVAVSMIDALGKCSWEPRPLCARATKPFHGNTGVGMDATHYRYYEVDGGEPKVEVIWFSVDKCGLLLDWKPCRGDEGEPAACVCSNYCPTSK
jgi:hypothetical protein